MAKISANGATEVARFDTRIAGESPELSVTRFVLCSDGRVLRQWVGLGGYSLYGRFNNPAKRTAANLRAYLEGNHYVILKEGR